GFTSIPQTGSLALAGNDAGFGRLTASRWSMVQVPEVYIENPEFVAAAGTRLKIDSPCVISCPQGLKPAFFSALSGTTKVVPFPKPFARRVLLARSRLAESSPY